MQNNVVQPTHDVRQIADVVVQPTHDVRQVANVVVQPIHDVRQVANVVVQPIHDVRHIANVVVQPIHDVRQVANVVVQPIHDVRHIANVVVQPTHDECVLADDVDQPIHDVCELADRFSLPIQALARAAPPPRACLVRTSGQIPSPAGELSRITPNRSESQQKVLTPKNPDPSSSLMRNPTGTPTVVFSPRRKPVSFAADVEASLDAVDKNPLFPNAATPVATARTALAKYTKAIDDVNHHVAGAVQVRDDLKPSVKAAMRQVVEQVQIAIDQQPDQGSSIAASAKMRLRKVPVRNQEDLSVSDGTLVGEVVLIAKAIPGAQVYYWEYSSDGLSWLRAPDTTKSRTTISGLTVGQKYYFRVHALTRKGPTNPTQVKTHVVR